jgi:hypothetical protein
MSVPELWRSYRASIPTGAPLNSPTPYSECLERVRSVLVFFAATGRANAAVLTELEFEVRSAIATARDAHLDIEDVATDLERLADTTLPPSAAASASRTMRRWVTNAPARPSTGAPTNEPGELSA